MKTTVELPDDLVIEAKKLAAERRVPLRLLIENGLRAELRRPLQADAREKCSIQWVSSPGAAPENINDRERMHDWLREK